MDPLYHQTSAQFDEGGAKGLLLYNLGVHGGCRVLFDSCEVPGKCTSDSLQNNNSHMIDLSFAKVFAGTTQKCMACEKTVYLVDKLTADNRIYHKACFRCHHCKGTLKLGNCNSLEGVHYCRPQFDQLFNRTGSLDKSFEGITKSETFVFFTWWL